MQRILELVYFDILEFHRRALKFFKQRGSLEEPCLIEMIKYLIFVEAWRQLFRASWNDFRTRFQGILENLRRHRDLLENQASLVNFEAIQAARIAAENSTRAIEEALVKQQLISVRDWLCSAKVFNDQERYTEIRSHSANYGQWLLKCRQMISWMDPASSAIPLFWLHGIPGAGESIRFSCSFQSIVIKYYQKV